MLSQQLSRLAGWTLIATGPVSAPAKAQPQPQSPGRFIEVEQGKLYLEECGAKSPTIVLVHDGVVHSAVWDDVWPGLCRQFRVVRYDRRGYGRSPASTAWHTETDDLLAVVQQAGPAPIVLVGSSHGGELSIDFTLRYPDRVQQLVLIGPVVSGFPYSEHFLERGRANFEPLAAGDVQGAIRKWSHDRYLIAPGNEKATNRLQELLTQSPHDLTHSSFIRPSRPALPRLGEIRVPTLILVGDADIPDVHAHVGAIEAGIPGARRVVMKDAGHILYLEHPELFVQLVSSFVRLHLR